MKVPLQRMLVRHRCIVTIEAQIRASGGNVLFAGRKQASGGTKGAGQVMMQEGDDKRIEEELQVVRRMKAAV